MLFGDKAGDANDHALFSDYLTEHVVDRYIAYKGRPDVPIFTADNCQALLTPGRRFIITTDDRPESCLQVSSKVSTQITHWLFSSTTTPQEYIQGKVDALLDALQYRSPEVVQQQHQIYKVKV